MVRRVAKLIGFSRFIDRLVLEIKFAGEKLQGDLKGEQVTMRMSEKKNGNQQV